jgi:hypothetical protein
LSLKSDWSKSCSRCPSLQGLPALQDHPEHPIAFVSPAAFAEFLHRDHLQLLPDWNHHRQRPHLL